MESEEIISYILNEGSIYIYIATVARYGGQNLHSRCN